VRLNILKNQQEKVEKEIPFLTVARLAVPPAEILAKFYEKYLPPEVLRTRMLSGIMVDLAHVIMLCEQGIIPPDSAAKICETLKEIEQLVLDGKFSFDSRLGTDFPQIEAYLIKKLGMSVGGLLHTGRSRCDRDAAVSRIEHRNYILRVIRALISFQRALLDVAERHVETVMPGYTHLQHAYPWTFGHYLLCYFDRFERDFQRIKELYKRINMNPLGTAVLAGSSFALDRERTAELLGFDGVIENSMDAGGYYQDYLMEGAAVLAILSSNINKLANELSIWASYEFRLVEIADEYCSTSSHMPQKKNPEGLEFVKASCGFVMGLPSVEFSKARMMMSTDMDQIFSVSTMCYAHEIINDSLYMMRGILETIKVYEDRMKNLAGAYWGTLGLLAEELVKKRGISFREAHQIAGRFVRMCILQGIEPKCVTSELLDEASQEIIGRPLKIDTQIIRKLLDPVNFMNSVVTKGSINPKETKRMLKKRWEVLREEETWLSKEENKLKQAREKIEEMILKLKAAL
jgi:argininosuccinate lyase